MNNRRARAGVREARKAKLANVRAAPAMTFRRTALLPKKNHATLGEGQYPA